jgi:hypothetical protein
VIEHGVADLVDDVEVVSAMTPAPSVRNTIGGGGTGADHWSRAGCPQEDDGRRAA